MTETLAERWLRDAAIELAPDVERAYGAWPGDVRSIRMRVGSVPGTRGTSRKVLGTFVPGGLTADDTHPQIYVSPLVDDGGVVLGILVHELCHWAAGASDGHGAIFGKVARGLGLEGPLRATKPGAALAARLAEVAEALGPYPHARIRVGSDPAEPGGEPGPGRPTQTTRQLRHECPSCGALFRATRKSPVPWCDGDTGAGAAHELVRTVRTPAAEGE